MDKIRKSEHDCDSACVLARRSFLAAVGSGAVTIGVGSSVIGQTAAEADVVIPQPINPHDGAFMERAFEMRQYAINHGDQAYGAVIVRDSIIVGQSWSRVILDQDPTGHAEMAAIRDASRRLNARDLSGTILYSSSRPCPMCEAAAFWAGVGQMFFERDIKSAGTPKLCG